MVKIYNVETMPPRLVIGRQTEAGVERVQFDCSEWLMRWPEMEISVWVTRPRENAAYPVVIERTGNTVTWTVSAADTAIDGEGSVEIMGIADDKRKISARVITNVFASGIGNTQDVPEGAQPWVDNVIEAANRAASAAEATAYPPIIGDNGNWWLWDANAKTYIDSGKPSQGGGGGAVESVNGKTGEVTLKAEDVGAIPNEDGAVQSNHLGSQVVKNANISYGAVSDSRIAEKTITFQRLSDACVEDIKGQQYTAQQPTSAQQQVARDNIAAASQEDLERLDDSKADKAYMTVLFEQLKALILAGDTSGALAVLDQAILDQAILA